MVKPQDLGRIIDEHPFFHDMEPELREALVCCAANERFVAGEHIFREGGEAHKFYLIREGQVAIEVEPPVRKPIILETLSAGEVLGWSWLVPPHRAAFAARAQTNVRVLSFNGTCLLRNMEANPSLGFAVLRRFLPVIAHRLSAARLQLLDLYGPAMAPPEKRAKPAKVEKAVKGSKGRNRSAVEGVKVEAEDAKAELKLAKKAAQAKPAKIAKKKGKAP